MKQSLVQSIIKVFDQLRLKLAGSTGILLIAILALLTGMLVGGVIVAFRWVIESAQVAVLAGPDPENFESLTGWHRLLLPLGGGLLLGLMFYFSSRPPARVGVIHVLERLGYHEGHLPFKNFVLQFIGGALSIISGHSVGREGPSIHLGAATASIPGQILGLPNNSIRVLVSCGAAAAIAASFNTPLAGVIFAMEVILMEYTITGFLPVILAAVSATTVCRLVYGAHPAFFVPALELDSYYELPLIVVMGVIIGALSAIFIYSVSWLTRKGREIPVWFRMTLAGLGVGLCAVITPQVMGIGYDTVNAAILGDIGIGLLLSILIFKLLATSIGIGLSLPGGLIGPTLFMGAITGSLTGIALDQLPWQISHPGLYAMLGMGAMMGATLQAPLAALIALLELTGNQNIIFPGMLAIVTANLACKEMFGYGSIYLSQMKEIGLDYRNDPISQSLRRFGVASVMNKSFAMVQPELTRQQAENLIKDLPHWLVINMPQEKLLMPAADLARFLQESDADILDMREIPSKRKQLAPVYQQYNLQQALKILDESDAEALYVIRRLGASADRVYGIVTYQDIEQAYR